jgi:hypothetical protein
MLSTKSRWTFNWDNKQENSEESLRHARIEDKLLKEIYEAQETHGKIIHVCSTMQQDTVLNQD